MSKKTKSNKLSIFITILLLLGVAGGLVYEYRYQKLIEMQNTGTEDLQLFEIEIGSTIKTISSNLETEEIILSAWAFERYAKKQGLAEKFQAGRFYISGNSTITEVS